MSLRRSITTPDFLLDGKRVCGGGKALLRMGWHEFEMLEKGIRRSLTEGKFPPARLCMPDFTNPNIHGGNNIGKKQERPQNLPEQAQLCAH